MAPEQYYQQELVATQSEIKAGDLKLPISFRIIEGGKFDIRGTSREAGWDTVISGKISDDVARIDHTFIEEELRNQGVGRNLLSALEVEFEKHGVGVVFATFTKPNIIEFFLFNGYKIIPVASMPESERTSLGIDINAFDARVQNDENFKRLQSDKETQFKKILLRKEIGKK